MSERNYWMFRSKGSKVRDPKFCIDNNVITYGWSGLKHKLATEPEKALEEIKEHHKTQLSMARNFTHIKKGDIVVLPYWGGVAIGETTSDALFKDEWKDGDGPNHFEVKWLCKCYDRKNLSSAMQVDLNLPPTFLNLSEKYKQELETLIEKFEAEKVNKIAETIDKIAEHINNSNNLSFGDTEFERFIMHLFELEYPGLQTEYTNNRKESVTGTDFTGSINYKNIGIEIILNVQVKQHQGNASASGLHQVNKSNSDAEYTKNILVTTGKTTEDLKKEAKELGVILIDNKAIAEMILNNFSEIDEKYKGKLRIIDTIDFI